MAGYDWDSFWSVPPQQPQSPATQPQSLLPQQQQPEPTNEWDKFWDTPTSNAMPEPAQPETDYLGRAMQYIKDTANYYMAGASRTPGTLAWMAEKATSGDMPGSDALFPLASVMRKAGQYGADLAVESAMPDLTPEQHADVVNRLDPFKVGAEALQDLSNQSAKWWENRVSEGYRKDAEANIIERDENGNLSLGSDWNLTTIIAGAAASANEMMLTAGMSVGSTVLTRSAIRAGFPTLIKAAEGGSVRAARILKFADMVGGATAGGASEGILAAGAAGAATEQQVLGMSHDALMQSSPRYRAIYDSAQGEDEGARRRYATEAVANEAGMSVARNVGLATFVLGAPMGAFYGRVGARAFSKGTKDVFEAVEGTVAGRTLTGAVGEAAQETAQSGAEQLLTNIGIRDYANDKQDIFEGVANAMAKGGLVGGVLGGFTSAALDSKDEKPAKPVKPTKPSPEMTARTDELLTQLEANGVSMADVTKVFRWAGSKGVAGLAGGRTHMELNRALQHLAETGALPDVVSEAVGEDVDDDGYLTEQAFAKDQKYYGFTDGARFTPVAGGDAGAIITALRDDGANGYAMRDGTVLVPTTKQGVDSLRMVADRVRSATGATFNLEALGGQSNGTIDTGNGSGAATRRASGQPGNPGDGRNNEDRTDAGNEAGGASGAGSGRSPAAAPVQAVSRGEDHAEAGTKAPEGPAAGAQSEQAGAAPPELTGRAANVATKLADTDIPVSASGRVTVAPDTDAETAQRAIDTAANDAATSRDNDFTEPTDGQIRGGNYRKGKVRLAGANISIENPRGSIRKSKPGTPKWSRKLKHHYGYIAGTRAPDGEPVDVYLGSRAHDTTAPVFVIQQNDPKTGEYDEPKVMQGFDSAGAAKDAYLSEFPKGWKGYGGITEFTNEQYREWIKSGDTDVPLNPMSRAPILSLRAFETIDVPAGTEDVGAIAMRHGAELADDGRSMRVPRKNAARLRKALGIEEKESGSREVRGNVPSTEAGAVRDAGGVRGSDQRVSPPGRARAARAGKPLEGLPGRFRVDGVVREFGPHAPAREAARAYAKSSGIPYTPPRTYAKVDEERATRIAQAFEEMQHAPNDPQVKAAYRAMIDETLAQWQAIKATGLAVEFIKPGQPDPYAGNPRKAILDVVENNHLWVFPTDFGFGGSESANVDISGNPLLEMTDEIIDGKRAQANDIFRIVHDYFGHIKEGVGFRAEGEENAWRAHSAMYSPLARKAMTTETRGQNSWVNYGPFGAFNKTASGEATQYAPQKIGILPDWVIEEGASDEGGPVFSLKAVGDLVIMHNISAENLRHAARVGGLPIPSLAVTKVDTPLDGFGEITLLGDAEMADPKGPNRTRVFGGDIYSPRYPTVSYKLSDRALTSLLEKLKPYAKETKERWSISKEDALGDLTQAASFRAYVAEKRGERAANDIHVLEEEGGNLLREVGAEERIRNGYTPSGNRRYKKHDLATVVAMLKKEMRGGEGFFYGAGSIRAKFTPQFKSLDAIRKARDRLVSKEEFEKTKDAINNDLFALADSLAPYYQYDANRFGFTNTVGNVIADSARGGLARQLKEYGFNDVPSDVVDEIRDFIEALRTLPTEYFEAKIVRAVGIHEFRAAVVPTTTPEDVVSMLRSRGLEVSTYDRNEPGDRARAIKEAATKEQGILFSLKHDVDAGRAKNAQDMPARLDVLDGMYSAIYDTIANRPDMPRKALPAAEWKRILTNAQTKGYFKKEEYDWLGMDQFLDDRAAYVDNANEGQWTIVDATGAPVTSGRFDSREEAEEREKDYVANGLSKGGNTAAILTDKVTPAQLLTFIAENSPQMEEVLLGEGNYVDEDTIAEIRADVASEAADRDMENWASENNPYSIANDVTTESYEDEDDESDTYYELVDDDGYPLPVEDFQFESESEAKEKLAKIQKEGLVIGGSVEERYRPATKWRIEDRYGTVLSDGYESESDAEDARQSMEDEWNEENIGGREYERAREQAFEDAYDQIDYDAINSELDARGIERGKPTQYGSYTTPGGGDSQSYRELLLKYTKEGDSPYNAPHFDGENRGLMLHVRFDDRSVRNGDEAHNALFIEEIQSDWHQAGRDRGYIGEEDPAIKAAAERAYTEAKEARLAAVIEVHPYVESLKTAIVATLIENSGFDAHSDMVATEQYTKEEVEFWKKEADTNGKELFNIANAMLRQRDVYMNTNLSNRQVKWLYANESVVKARDEAFPVFQKLINAEEAEREARYKLDSLSDTRRSVPQAPFKKSWEDLGFKQALAYAVEHGYDAIAWTTGAHHVARYQHALTQVVDRIAYTRFDDHLAGDEFVHAVTAYQGHDRKFSDVFDKQGMSRNEHHVQHGQPSQRVHLREIVGQEKADEILSGKYDKPSLVTKYKVTTRERRYQVKYRIKSDGYRTAIIQLSKKQAEEEANDLRSRPDSFDEIEIVETEGLAREHMLDSEDQVAEFRRKTDELNPFATMEYEVEEKKVAAPFEWKATDVIGGKGFKAAYDIRMPNNVGKYVKKWGAKVEEGRIVGDDDAFAGQPEMLRKVHVVKITDAMRQSLMQTGQPVWSIKKPGAKRLLVGEVKRHIATITAKWSDAPKVNVVQGIGQLPQRFRAALQSIGRDAMPEGFYDPQTGETWMIADALTDTAAVERVLFEERLGHHGLRTTFKGEAFNKLLDSVFASIEAKPEAAEIAELYRSAYGASSKTEFNRRVAEEYLAKLKPDQDQSVWQMFVAFVRDWLRKRGFVRTWTDNDIRSLMARIHDNVRFGHTSRSAAAIGPATYSLSDDGRTSTGKRDVKHTGQRRDIRTSSFAAVVTPAYDEAPLLGVSGFVGSERGLKDLARLAREEGHKGLLFAPGVVTADRVAKLGTVTESDGTVQVRFANDARPGSDPVFSMRHRAHGSPEVEQILGKTVQPSDHDLTFWGRVQNTIAGLKETSAAGVAQQLKVGWIDSAAQIEEWERGANNGQLLDASQSAYKMISLTRNLPQVMGAIARAGVPRFENGAFVPVAGRQGLYDIFRPLYDTSDGRNLTYLWEGYAVARRSNQLIKQTNRDGTSKEKLLSQAEIDKLLALERQYPFFRDVFDRWQQFNRDMLDLAVDRGALSAEDAAMWKANDYVPFYRAIEEAESDQPGPTRKRGLSDQAVRSKRLEGSDHRIQPLLENIVLNTASIVDKIYKNETMNRIAALGTSLGFMEEVPMRNEAVKLTNDQLVRALGKAGFFAGQMYSERARAVNRALWNSDFDDPSSKGYALGLRIVEAMTPEQREQWHTFFRKVKPVGHNIVSAMVSGKPVYYEVKDPLALRAIADMGFTDFGKLIDLMGGAKNLLTTMVTMDPGFMIANLMRDTLASWVTSGSNFLPLSSALDDAREIWTQTGLAQQIAYAGGTGANFYDPIRDIRGVMREITPTGPIVVRGARASWRAYRKIGAISEQINRMAIARAVLAKGGSIAEAAYQAQDILNFSQRGDSVAAQLLVRTVPFMNARIQGLYRLYKGATGRDSEDPMKARLTFLLKGSAIALASMLLALANAGDDRYEKIPDDQKDTYWHFFVGNQHFAIPKPFEVGVLAATIPERIVRRVMGLDGWKELRESLLRAAGDTLAFNPIPQAAKPLIEQWANRSFFTGNPIVDLNMQGLLPEAQYNPWTSETARAVAELMPDFMPEAMRSPVRIEALARGYFGTIGAALLKMGDSAARATGAFPAAPESRLSGVPLVDQALARFVRGNPELESRNKYADDLYDALEKADDTYRTVMAYMRQGRVQEAQELMGERRDYLSVRGALHDASSALSAFNQQQRMVMVSDLDPETKRARIEEIVRARNAMLKQISPYLGLVD